MNADKKLQLIESIYIKHPNMQIRNVMHKVRKHEKAEELRRPSPDPRGVVAMIRRLTGKA